MKVYLESIGYNVNRKRIKRYYEILNIAAIYPKPNLSKPNKDHEIFPYLLRDVEIKYTNQVWSTDITYIPMGKGFMYLCAVIDWYSRRVLSWTISNTLDKEFCIEALNDAIYKFGIPDIFNTDQGSQFTSKAFIGILKENTIKISMDGKGRALDNIFIERFWRSLKYEHIYLKQPQNCKELYEGLEEYFDYYNNKRPHQSLDYSTPCIVYERSKYIIV